MDIDATIKNIVNTVNTNLQQYNVESIIKSVQSNQYQYTINYETLNQISDSNIDTTINNIKQRIIRIKQFPNDPQSGQNGQNEQYKLLYKMCVHILVNSFLKQLMLSFMYLTVRQIGKKADEIDKLNQQNQQECGKQVEEKNNLIKKLTELINQGFPLISQLDEQNLNKI
jgi:hypothetical protein